MVSWKCPKNLYNHKSGLSGKKLTKNTAPAIAVDFPSEDLSGGAWPNV